MICTKFHANEEP